MNCSKNIRQGDAGTLLLHTVSECVNGVDTLVDITNASTLQVRLHKIDSEDNIIGTRDVTGTVYTGGANSNGTDGIVQYVITTNDSDFVGKLSSQAIVSFTGSGPFHSSIVKTKVLENLPIPTV